MFTPRTALQVGFVLILIYLLVANSAGARTVISQLGMSTAGTIKTLQGR